MGIHDRPLESARQSIDRAKARRDFSLELRLNRKPHIRRGLGLRARFRAEEIEIAFDRAADVESDVERLEVGIGGLHSGAFLTVLNDRVMDLEFSRRRDHVVGAVALEEEIGAETKFPVLTWIVNQRRLRKHAFEAEVIAEEPDQTAARRHNRIRINRAAGTDHPKDLIFLERKRDPYFPRHVDRIARDVILEIRAWINLDTGSGMVV